MRIRTLLLAIALSLMSACVVPVNTAPRPQYYPVYYSYACEYVYYPVAFYPDECYYPVRIYYREREIERYRGRQKSDGTQVRTAHPYIRPHAPPVPPRTAHPIVHKSGGNDHK